MVKRISVQGGPCWEWENQGGEYVSYEDYAALQQKLDALAAENAYLKESVAMHAEGFSECSVCGHEEPCETHDIVWMAKETPTTDAYLNSVRAEGIQMAIDNLKALDASPYAIHSLECKFHGIRSSTHDTADKVG